MFTGIVDRGEVVEVERQEQGHRIRVRSQILEGIELGASVAVNGVCLTVTEREGGTAAFDVSPETMSRSTLGGLEGGDGVNLERPLRAGDELGGHIVQGHVDAVGRVEEVVPDGNGMRLRISVPDGLSRYIVEKGSVTVDGVSLTVTRCEGEWFEVALIPHTLEVSTLGGSEAGRPVNLEVDILAKYVEKLASVANRAS